MVFKLLIIDDSDKERQYLKRLLDWESYDISIVGEASNGMEGLALINQLLPDIVITDIVMPEMDGISLIARLRDNFPNMKVIIMSCYGEFRYAQYAVKYKVSDYILKPIISTELEHVIKKVTAEISGSRPTRSDSQADIEDLVIDNLNELTKVFVHDLLDGKYKENEQIAEKLEVYKLEQFCGKQVMVMLLEWEEPFLPSNLYEAVGNTEDHLSKYVLQIEKNEYAVIFGRKELTEADYGQLPYDLKSEWKDCGCPNLTIGVSSVRENIRDLPSCYEEANQALDAKFYLGKNRVIFYGDLADISYCTKDLDMKEIHDQLKNILHTGNKADIEEFTDDVINACVRKNKLYAKIVMINLISNCQIFMLNINHSLSDIFEDETVVYERILSMDTIPEMRQWIFHILSRINDFIIEKEKSNAHRIVDIVTEIMKKRYHEKLTLDGIAAEIHYHPVYINSVLKQVTGKTFLQMLIEYRLQMAMELLRHSDSRIYEICEKVGYWNQSYFTQAFKEFTGMTPGEYRDKESDEGDKDESCSR